MKQIGGYFELELDKKNEYYPDAIKLNLARNGLVYILRSKRYKKIYIPYYICDSIINVLEKFKLNYEFYSINKKLEPQFAKKLQSFEVFLYVNYFGINNDLLKKASKIYKNIIVDNSQAFFAKPLIDADTIYSPRKFFGVPDGCYLYTNKILKDELIEDNSVNRLTHLVKRIEEDARGGYKYFLQNEERFKRLPLRKMSKITEILMKTIDYNKVREKRNENYYFLHQKLSRLNLLSIKFNRVNGPMSYPFLPSKPGLREYLIKNNIFIPCYWKEVLKRVKKDSFEFRLVNSLTALPIDQRYDLKDMDYIIAKIKEFYEK